MKVLIPFTLDVKKTNVQKIIHANKGEGLDRKLQITLVNGSEPLILDSENQSVQFIAKKPDGTTIYNSTAIKDGKVIIYLTSQTTAAVGDVDCQLEVVSTDEGSVGSGVIYSAKFTIAVEEALYDTETVQSSNEFSELIELIERVEKQVTVYPGEGTPSTDPEEFDNIKELDFYYDSTNKKYYYATNVTALTVVWEKLVNITELIALLANYYTKTEVNNLIAKDAVIWHGTANVNARNAITEAVEGIKEGDIYIQEDENQVFKQACVVYAIAPQQFYMIQPINNAYVSSSNPPSSTATNNYISLIDSTIWINSTTNRVYIKTASIGEPPSDTYVWQDLTGNKVWFGDDNPDNGTKLGALGKVSLSDYVGIQVGDIYIYEGTAGYNNSYHQYTCIKKDSTYAYLKKTKNLFLLNEQLPTTNFELGTTANLTWKEWESVYEAGTFYIYNENTYVIKNVIFSRTGEKTKVLYVWDEFDFCHYDDAYSWFEQLNTNKAEKSTTYTKEEVDTALLTKADKSTTYTKTEVDTELGKKQNAIDSTHKLDADNVDDSESTNKFVSAAEKAAIGKEPKYELIKTIDISQLSEPVSMIIIDEDEQGNAFAYDDFFIELDNLKASDSGKLQIILKNGTTNYANYSRNATVSNTAHTFNFTCERKNSRNFYSLLGGYVNGYQTIKLRNDITYADKIDTVNIITDSTFKEGTINIYGKVKY